MTPMSEPLGSGTPQCRVLTEDIEIHWWDGKVKSGNECLCGVAARVKRDPLAEATAAIQASRQRQAGLDYERIERARAAQKRAAGDPS